MATGNTTTSSLTDSLPTVIASGRQIREQDGVVAQLCDRKTLGKGLGLTWHEVSFAQLTATAITENTVLDNPQQMSDTDLSITPTVIGIETLITDRVAARIDPKAFAQTGSLAQHAIERKKDEDGLVAIDGFTTSLCGTGTTLTVGHIAAGVSRIRGNATEPGMPPFRCILHGYQIKDIQDDIVAGVGTYNITEGRTADVFANGYSGKVFDAEVYLDGNIDISSGDAKGGVFAKEALIIVQGRAPRAETKRRPEIGGGATSMYYYDEYAYGERSSGNWGYEIYSDATAPTS